MPKLDLTLTLAMHQSACMEACRVAISELDWILDERSMCHLCCRDISWLSLHFHSPVRVLITTEPASDTSTNVSIHGETFGLGPIINRALRRETARLAEQIDRVARRTAPRRSSPPRAVRSTSARRIHVGRRSARRPTLES